ncbi:MAG TPA: dihydrolipoamide acetyltransferase family protein [Gemmatimonadaceae bacterium]|nr:dihydrolipoamide acetyltransferase family protein [Gemmatimonadaceae bacterium]
MATKVFMEALSPTMEEGRLVKWLKNEGDAVKSGDPIAEVETDKAIMELVARGDGVLRKRLINDGDARPVGQLVGVIAAPDENIDAIVAEAGASAAAAASSSAAPAAQGATQQPSQVVAQSRETAGASPVPRIPNEAQGEASAPPQQKIAASAGAPPASSRPTAPPAAQPADGNGGSVRSSPLARRLAREQGVDLGQLRGTGPGGRIIKRDIEAAASVSAGAPPAAPRVAPPPVSREGDFQDIALTQIRKTIARRLSESIGPVPTFYLTAEYDLGRIDDMRKAMAALGDDFKVSVNDVLLKAVATALTQHPEVNAHWLGDRIRMFNRVHLGVAVATDDGLIVPVVFDADRKSMRQISAEVKEMAKLARERRLKPEQYTGSTFSVSNLGMYGIDQFTAIINPPETGILAVGRAEDKPIVMDGEVAIRKRLRITMSCDHRAVDGAVGARFLQTLGRMIENPMVMLA